MGIISIVKFNVNKDINAKLVRKWIEALRSGKYVKVRGALRKEAGFCSLGVLCDIEGYEWHYEGYFYILDGQQKRTGSLPSAIAEEVNCFCSFELVINGDTFFVDNLNDDGFSFSQIADILECAISQESE